MSTPDASCFGPDRIAMYDLLLNLLQRAEFFRDVQALDLARRVSDGLSQEMIDLSIKRFREADEQYNALTVRCSALARICFGE